jgi:hypothetical protein
LTHTHWTLYLTNIGSLKLVGTRVLSLTHTHWTLYPNNIGSLNLVGTRVLSLTHTHWTLYPTTTEKQPEMGFFSEIIMIL